MPSQLHSAEMAPNAVGALSTQEEPPNDDGATLTPLGILESGRDAIEPSRNAFADARPTKQYQALLLISGFTMIFHLFGINQTFGVFQVSGLPRRAVQTCHAPRLVD